MAGNTECRETKIEWVTESVQKENIYFKAYVWNFLLENLNFVEINKLRCVNFKNVNISTIEGRNILKLILETRQQSTTQ